MFDVLARVGHQPMVNVAVARFVCPCRLQLTVADPPLPFDSMCQDQLTTLLLPTVFAEPSNETGLRPVEYTTSADSSFALTENTVISTGRTRVLEGRRLGGVSERRWKIVVWVMDLVFTLPAALSMPVLTLQRSTPQAVEPRCTIGSV